MKQEIELAPSAECTGIDEQKTPIMPIKGIPEGAILIHFNVDIVNNTVQGVWLKKRYNNVGTEIQSEQFTSTVRDIGEIGTVDVDPLTLVRDMDTYEKTKDENPVLTNYFKQLGTVILSPMLEMIAQDNGYVTPKK